MDQATSPPISKSFRVDQVGSLLRPPMLKEVYAWHGNGEATDDELGRIQDQSVKDLIAKQEAHGLSILTDGEFRRLTFLRQLRRVRQRLYPEEPDDAVPGEPHPRRRSVATMGARLR